MVKSGKGILALCLLVVLAAAVSGPASLYSQEGDAAPGSKRRVKMMGKPQYPDLARKLNLSGVVKIEVTVGADGKVRKTRIIGGHPVFAPEAEKAAMQTEFEPGPKETSEVIEFRFGSQ